MKCKGCNTIIKGSFATCPECGRPVNAEKTTPLSLFQSPVSTVIADRYEVIEEIGKGGMGRVYKAWDRTNEEFVAIKIIRPEYADDEIMLGRFKKEMLLTRNIFSENVVKIHSFQVIDDINFIVMNYIDGESLEQVLDTTGHLDTDAIISIAVQILKGLKAAHKETVIHRDLKPPNIMIDRSGKVSITDFGLARKRDASRVTTTSSLLGTPQYIAPEQWFGDKPDARTDIYAFGIMLYEMAFGELPFKSSTDYGYMDLHLNAPIIFPKGSGIKIPGFLKTIILKCLEKKPVKRYQNVDQVLEEIMEGKASRSFSTKIRNRVKRTPKFVWIAALFFFVIGAAGFTIHMINKSEEKKNKKLTIAVLNFSDMTDNEEFKFLSKGVPDLLTTDLSQSRHFYILPHEKVFQNLRDTGNIDRTDFDNEMIKKLAKLCGVNYMITGSITSSGDDIRVDIILRDGETGEFIAGALEECKGVENIYGVIDRLTWEVKKRIGITPSQMAHDPDLRVASITTENITALTHFLKGRQLFHLKKYKHSATLLKKAISIDRKYAGAYYILHRNMFRLDKDAESKEYFLELVKNIQRLSEREQLMFTALKSYDIDKNFKIAEEQWNNMLKKFPYDIEAKLHLAGVNRLLKHYRKAETLYLDLKKSITNSIPYNNLLYIYLCTGQTSKLNRLLNEAEEIFPTSEWLINYKWKSYIISGKFKDALTTIKSPYYASSRKLNQQVGITYLLNNKTNLALNHFKSISKTPNFYLPYLMIASGHISLGQVNEARDILIKGLNIAKTTKQDYSIIMLSQYLAYIEESLSNFNRSIDICKSTREFILSKKHIYNRSNLLLIQGISLIKSNTDIDHLKEVTNELSILNPNYYSYIPELYSEILLNYKNNNYSRIEELYLKYPKENWYNNMHAYLLNVLLDLYIKNSQYKKALHTCNRISRLTLGRVMYGDIYALSFYYKGKILLIDNQKEAAAQSFNTFLKLWYKAPKKSYPQITDAKEQLKLLNL